MRVGLAFLFLVGCAIAQPFDVGLDAPALDVPDAGRAPIDVPRADAPRDAPGPRPRDPRLPPLTGRCHPLSFDLDDPSSYDTPRELALAFRTATCANALRCADPGGAFWCDPIHIGAPPPYVVPIDTTLARVCLEALITSPCEGAIPLPERCIELDWDRLPDGAACSRDDGCRSGFCDGADPFACTGRCAPEPACPACSPDERCVHGRCEAQIPLGGACLFFPTPCVPGAFCAGDRCVRIPGPGEPCALIGGPTPFPVCSEGHACRGGICVAFESAEVGEPCDAVALCVDGSDCVDGTCRARAGLGEPCQPLRCVDGLYCGERGVCAPMVAPGCACDETVTCTIEHRCIDGICRRIGDGPTPCELGCPERWCAADGCDFRFDGERCRDDACNEEHAYCDLATQLCEPILYPAEDCSAHPEGCYGGDCVDGLCEPRPRDPCHP